jgi:hypothetical protein
MEFLSALWRNEIMSFAGKYMEFEDTILSEARFINTKVACFLSYVEDSNNCDHVHIYM